MPHTGHFNNSAITAEAGFDKPTRILCLRDSRPDYHQLPVLVLNARDERIIAWLIKQVGLDAVLQACGKIAGKRKPYPTNLAKVLRLSIPHSVINTPASVAREHIRELLTLLSSSHR